MRRIKKNDEVMVITGRSRGRIGRVLQILSNDRVLVENVNLVRIHVKPNPMKNERGGIVEKEAPLHISNIMPYNPRTKRGDRIGIKYLEDGRKVRYFKSDGEVVDTV
jgi:large subunit ribosomal protein L24